MRTGEAELCSWELPSKNEHSKNVREVETQRQGLQVLVSPAPANAKDFT